MRVYINHFNLDALPNVLTMLDDKLAKTETYIQIYSIDGIYQIDMSAVKKQTSVDSDIEILNDYHENFTLIVDKSYFIEEDAPGFDPDHISTRMKRCIFETSKASPIKLVIEGETVEEKGGFFKNKTSQNLVPNNIYFEMANNLNVRDALVKKELIGFLSLLN
jgi:hypothetical protein